MIRLLTSEPEYYETVKILRSIESQLKKNPNNLIGICESMRNKYSLLDKDGAELMLQKYTKEDVRNNGILVCTKDEANVKRVELFIKNWVGFVEYRNGKTDYKIANLKSSRI